MAKIRMLTLEEWFSAHQLTYAFRKYCHNPITIDVDVTRMVQASEEAGVRFSPTAAVLKAVGVVLRLRPSLNRMLFHTPFGQRIVEFDSIGINLPVQIENKGDPVLSAMVVKDPSGRSALDIHRDVREFAKSDLSDKPIARFLSAKKNTWYNRLLLRVLHFVIFSFPRFYTQKGAGAVAVSSLVNQDNPAMWVRGIAIGPNSFTVGVSGLKKTNDGRYILLLELDVNHSVLSGIEGMEVCNLFSRTLHLATFDKFYCSEGYDKESVA